MKEKLHFTQLAIMIYMTQSGVILFSLPRIIAEGFGTNGWLAIIGLSAIVVVNLYLIILVNKKGNGISIFTIIDEGLPKLLKYPLYLYLIGSCAVIGILVAKNYSLLIQLTMFPDVNPNLLLFYFVLISMYFLSKGIYNIGKITVVCFFFTAWTVLLMALVIPEFSFVRLTPFFFRDGQNPIEKGLEAYTAFLGFEIAIFLIPYVQKDGKFNKAVLVGHFFTTFIYVIICFFAFGFFSLEQLRNILYPTQIIFKYMETPIIERIENLIFSLFLLKVIVTVVMYHWIALEGIKQIFKKANEKILIFFLFLTTFVIGTVPEIQREVNEFFTMVTTPYSFFLLGLPVILLLLLWLQDKKNRREKNIA